MTSLMLLSTTDVFDIYTVCFPRENIFYRSESLLSRRNYCDIQEISCVISFSMRYAGEAGSFKRDINSLTSDIDC